MPTVKLEPTDEYPVPFSTDDDPVPTFAEELMVSAGTAELLSQLGAQVEVDKRTAEEEKNLLKKVIADKDVKPLRNLSTSLGVSSFLTTYGQQLAFDAAQARAAITAKLMEIANCGEIKYELKALELLGKHSDIGLFTERSEVTINYKNPTELENAIKERVKRLMNADIIDVTPLGQDLDEELGVVNTSVGEWGDEEANFDETPLLELLDADADEGDDESDDEGEEEDGGDT